MRDNSEIKEFSSFRSKKYQIQKKKIGNFLQLLIFLTKKKQANFSFDYDRTSPKIQEKEKSRDYKKVHLINRKPAIEQKNKHNKEAFKTILKKNNDDYNEVKLFDILKKIQNFHSNTSKEKRSPLMKEIKKRDKNISFISFKNEKQDIEKKKNERFLTHLKQVLNQKTEHLSNLIKNF